MNAKTYTITYDNEKMACQLMLLDRILFCNENEKLVKKFWFDNYSHSLYETDNCSVLIANNLIIE